MLKSYPHISLLAALLFLNSCLQAQVFNLGNPTITNYSKKDYKAGTQNWDATQDQHGVMYWANNEGLLRYDGSKWSCMPVSNRTVVRSVAFDKQSGYIYIGAQNELGFFKKEKNGSLKYNSLVSLLPDSLHNFADVWDIVFFDKKVFFRTNQYVFEYDGTSLKPFRFEGELTALFTFGNTLLLQQDYSNLLKYANSSFNTHLHMPELKSAITGILTTAHDTMVLATLKHAFFYITNDGQYGRWSTPHDALLQEKRIYHATQLPDGAFALGTSLDGAYILDSSKQLTNHLFKKNGLQNNNILNTFTDRSGNLWLGLDNGIACVVTDAPFSAIIPDGDLQGTGYSASILNQKLFLGVSNGLYSIPWKPVDLSPTLDFKKITNSDGQVWATDTLGGGLIVGHHEGTFRVDANQSNLQLLSKESGAWTFVSLSPNYMLGGNYNGVVLYKKVNGRWVFDEKLKGISESCRILVKDADGVVWIAHPYRGLYKITWDEANKSEISIQFYHGGNGLPSNLNNSVHLIAGNAIFTTQNGIMRYHKESQAFVLDEDFNSYFKNAGVVQYLKEDTKGNIWYVTNKEAGMLQVSDYGIKKSVTKKVHPELKEKLVAGFEFIFPIDEHNVLFGAEQGFVHYNGRSLWIQDTILEVVITGVLAKSDADTLLAQSMTISESGLSKADPIKLAHQFNQLSFSFSATDYKDPAFLQYRVRLVGLGDAWSEWSHNSSVQYTNLSPDNYTFEVQAQRKDGRISPTTAYAFIVTPPWYKGPLMMTMYALGILALLIGYLRRQKRIFETEKEQLTEQHQIIEAKKQEEVEQSKAALTEIQNAKLESEIQFAHQDLATATMHLVQKGEILLTVKENLGQILKKSVNPEVKKDLQHLLNLLNFDAKLDDDWQQFAYHFDQVHVDFLKRLREQYPQLSSNDHKLCAYLRMNLSSKEIATLMNISVRGVEASRYRLRKRLELSNDSNLTDIIMGL